jgi:hypothetical protein
VPINPKDMEVDVVADRSLYIADVLTVSPYDDQHIEAAKFLCQAQLFTQAGPLVLISQMVLACDLKSRFQI